MMKQSSALPITSPKNIPISRKQHLRNHHPSVAIFVSVEEPDDSHEGWKARFLICVQFWSNLNNYCGFVSFLISHKQPLRKSVAETLLRGLPETTFQNPPTPLKLAYCCVARSQKLYLWVKCGHERTLFSPSLVSSLHHLYIPTFL